MAESMFSQITLDTIQRLKREKNAIILAHNYQLIEVQQTADFVGDSLQLAIEAAQARASMIVFCGVRFMAETAKLLNPEARVLLSHDKAGCPMADMISAAQLREWKAEFDNPYVICYVNSSVGVKAESDICCTSSNAVRVITQAPGNRPLLFVPDRNLGTNAATQAGRDIHVWDGWCTVHHHMIDVRDIAEARRLYPDYAIVVHPECRPEVVEKADFAASTKGIADYVAGHDKVVVGTEVGMVEQLKTTYPAKSIVALSEKAVCVNMKKTTLRDVLLTLAEERNAIEIDPDIAARAVRSVKAMLALG